jgi:hypothetical protein
MADFMDVIHIPFPKSLVCEYVVFDARIQCSQCRICSCYGLQMEFSARLWLRSYFVSVRFAGISRPNLMHDYEIILATETPMFLLSCLYFCWVKVINHRPANAPWTNEGRHETREPIRTAEGGKKWRQMVRDVCKVPAPGVSTDCSYWKHYDIS